MGWEFWPGRCTVGPTTEKKMFRQTALHVAPAAKRQDASVRSRAGGHHTYRLLLPTHTRRNTTASQPRLPVDVACVSPAAHHVYAFPNSTTPAIVAVADAGWCWCRLSLVRRTFASFRRRGRRCERFRLLFNLRLVLLLLLRRRWDGGNVRNSHAIGGSGG